MSEITGSAAPKRIDVVHGITINVVRLPAGNPLQASCLCGWQSPIVPSRPRAVAEGQAHTCRIATGDDLGSTDTIPHPRYLDRVAKAVAERICTRGVVLTVDELATIAMALDCSASDLAAAAPDDRRAGAAEYAEHGMSQPCTHMVRVEMIAFVSDGETVDPSFLHRRSFTARARCGCGWVSEDEPSDRCGDLEQRITEHVANVTLVSASTR